MFITILAVQITRICHHKYYCVTFVRNSHSIPSITHCVSLAPPSTIVIIDECGASTFILYFHFNAAILLFKILENFVDFLHNFTIVVVPETYNRHL